MYKQNKFIIDKLEDINLENLEKESLKLSEKAQTILSKNAGIPFKDYSNEDKAELNRICIAMLAVNDAFLLLEFDLYKKFQLKNNIIILVILLLIQLPEIIALIGKIIQ